MWGKRKCPSRKAPHEGPENSPLISSSTPEVVATSQFTVKTYRLLWHVSHNQSNVMRKEKQKRWSLSLCVCRCIPMSWTNTDEGTHAAANSFNKHHFRSIWKWETGKEKCHYERNKRRSEATVPWALCYTAQQQTSSHTHKTVSLCFWMQRRTRKLLRLQRITSLLVS